MILPILTRLRVLDPLPTGNHAPMVVVVPVEHPAEHYQPDQQWYQEEKHGCDPDPLVRSSTLHLQDLGLSLGPGLGREVRAGLGPSELDVLEVREGEWVGAGCLAGFPVVLLLEVGAEVLLSVGGEVCEGRGTDPARVFLVDGRLGNVSPQPPGRDQEAYIVVLVKVDT